MIPQWYVLGRGIITVPLVCTLILAQEGPLILWEQNYTAPQGFCSFLPLNYDQEVGWGNEAANLSLSLRLLPPLDWKFFFPPLNHIWTRSGSRQCSYQIVSGTEAGAPSISLRPISSLSYCVWLESSRSCCCFCGHYLVSPTAVLFMRDSAHLSFLCHISLFLTS